METKEKNNGQVNANNTVKADKKEQFVAGNPVNKVSATPAKEEPKKDGEQPKETPAQPQGAPVAPAPPVAPVAVAKPFTLNLEETLKLVAELNRKKIQRDKLMETVTNLESFEIAMKEDEDETDGNPYQGCTLTIEDDNRRKFTTKNPVIIFTIAQQVNAMCVNKLAEIEAGIVIPA